MYVVCVGMSFFVRMARHKSFGRPLNYLAAIQMPYCAQHLFDFVLRNWCSGNVRSNPASKREHLQLEKPSSWHVVHRCLYECIWPVYSNVHMGYSLTRDSWTSPNEALKSALFPVTYQKRVWSIGRYNLFLCAFYFSTLKAIRVRSLWTFLVIYSLHYWHIG